MRRRGKRSRRWLGGRWRGKKREKGDGEKGHGIPLRLD